MLICLVLCAVAVLPTAISENVQMQETSALNNLVARAAAQNLADARFQMMIENNEEDQPPSELDGGTPLISEVYYPPLRSTKTHPLRADNRGLTNNPLLNSLGRTLDQFGDGLSLRRDTVLDPIGGGHLLKRYAALDPIGGGHLLKRENGFRALEPILRVNLLKREFHLRPLDSIGGGHLLKRSDGFGQLDSIGGGHLLKRDPLDSIGGGHLLKRDALDSIGGGHLLKREFGPRQLDSIGGGHLLRRSPKEQTSENYIRFNV